MPGEAGDPPLVVRSTANNGRTGPADPTDAGLGLKQVDTMDAAPVARPNRFQG